MKTLAGLLLAVMLGLFVAGLLGENPRPDLGFLSAEARSAFQQARFVPLGKPPEPANNPATPEKIALGRALYFDPRLSADGTVSCATCHHPDKAWADGEKTALGIHKQRGPRNSPTVLDSAFYNRLFWDSRAGSLEEQALGPIENPVEMGNKLGDMTLDLGRIAGYKPLFRAAFGSDEITAQRVSQAIAAFERTVLSGPSPFDRFLAGDKAALSAGQKRGLEVFLTSGGCTMCHNGPFLTTQMRLAGIRVPTLRNVALTAPYFADGSAASLADAVRNRSPKELSGQQRDDIEAFLSALSGQLPKIEAPATLPN